MFDKLINKITANKNYILVTILGFILAYQVNYKSTTPQALYLIWDKNCYHIHHWITYSILIILLLLYKHYSIDIEYLFIFFLIGLSLEDFLYRDVLKIRVNCNKMLKK